MTLDSIRNSCNVLVYRDPQNFWGRDQSIVDDELAWIVREELWTAIFSFCSEKLKFPLVLALPFPFLHVVNGSLGSQSDQVQRMYHEVNMSKSWKSKSSDDSILLFFPCSPLLGIQLLWVNGGDPTSCFDSHCVFDLLQPWWASTIPSPLSDHNPHHTPQRSRAHYRKGFPSRFLLQSDSTPRWYLAISIAWKLPKSIQNTLRCHLKISSTEPFTRSASGLDG